MKVKYGKVEDTVCGGPPIARVKLDFEDRRGKAKSLVTVPTHDVPNGHDRVCRRTQQLVTRPTPAGKITFPRSN